MQATQYINNFKNEIDPDNKNYLEFIKAKDRVQEVYPGYTEEARKELFKKKNMVNQFWKLGQ